MLLLGQLSEAQAFAGPNGFLGSRASFMMDVVVLAMIGVLPTLAYSIRAVKSGRFSLHKQLQLVLGIALLVAVAAFEIDIQTLSDWKSRAEPSPYFDRQQPWTSPAGMTLFVHLCFAVPTALLWIMVIVRAVRNFPHPPAPSPHSRSHARWAWAASLGMTFTAVTGWVFYWLAFVS